MWKSVSSSGRSTCCGLAARGEECVGGRFGRLRTHTRGAEQERRLLRLRPRQPRLSASGPRSLSQQRGGSPASASASSSLAADDGASSSVFQTVGERKVRHIPNLKSDDLRHPLDRQNTQLISLLPGIEGVVKAMLSPMSEEVALLENIGTSVLVGEEQLPDIYKLLCEAASVLQVDVPELYIRQDPQPNAYTLAITGRKPFIVMHTSLIDTLSPAEVQCVLAHELGHLKCNHGIWLTTANLLALGAISLLPMISSSIQESFLRWLRSAELTCDRAALVVAQDHKIVISTLMKLAGGSPTLSQKLNVDAFIKQAKSYDEATSSPLGWYLRNAQVSQLTHPLPVMRAREIEQWSRSPEYKKLLKRGRKYGSRDEEA